MREDRAGWVRECLERFEGPLLLYSGRILGDAHAAQDVVQEAFVRLLAEDPGTLGPRVRPWLYTVCRNLALDRRRRARLMERTNAEGLDGRAGRGGDPAEAAALRDAAAHAIRAVGRLPDAQQEVLRLRFQHGLSYREIAEVTGRTAGAVGVLVHEGVKTLRARLHPEPRAAAPGGVL